MGGRGGGRLREEEVGKERGVDKEEERKRYRPPENLLPYINYRLPS